MKKLLVLRVLKTFDFSDATITCLSYIFSVTRKRFCRLLDMSCCKQRDFLKYITAKKFRGLVGNVKKIEVLYYTPSFYKTLYFDFVPNNVNQKIFLSGCDGREMFVPSKLL